MQPFQSFLLEYATGRFEITTYPLWSPFEGDDGPPDFSTTAQPDQFLYHVTREDAARRIVAAQELRKVGSMMGTYQPTNAAGRVFLTDRSGVNFWYEKAWYRAASAGEARPGVVVLQVPKRIVPNIMPDDVGTREAGAPAWYVEGGFRL